MKIVSNNKLISRNKKIGNYTTIGSLVILGLGLYISFSAQTSEGFTWSLVCLLAGFLLSQVGIFFGNRWGRSPRPDELLSSNLKGLDDKYVLYHYVTKVNHLLVGPAGIWVLITYQQQGKISFDEKKQRFNQRGGNWYMKLFGQEGLGRPDQEVATSLADMKSFIKKEELEFPGLPEPTAAVIFVNPKVDVDAQDAPIPTMQVDKVKDFMRRKAKESPLPLDSLRLLQQSLPQDSID
jgi:hypothetical protein